MDASHNINMKEAVKDLIHESLGDDAKNEGPVECMIGKRWNIMGGTKTFIVTNNEAANKLFENYGKAMLMKREQIINDYILAHRRFGWKRFKYQVDYHKITLEVMKLWFLVNGLNIKSKYRNAAKVSSFQGVTYSLGIFQDRLMEEEVSMKINRSVCRRPRKTQKK